MKTTTITITLPAGVDGAELIKYAAAERKKQASAQAQQRPGNAKNPDITLADEEYLRQNIVNNLVADYVKAKTQEAAINAARAMAEDLSKKLG